MARGSLGSAKRSPTDPKATSNCCLPTSTAALIPPITCLRIVAGALTPSCRLIRARDPAAPSTVRALLPVGGAANPASTRSLTTLDLPACHALVLTHHLVQSQIYKDLAAAFFAAVMMSHSPRAHESTRSPRRAS